MSSEDECIPLFVYGTLRPGQAQYQLLRGKTCAEYPAYLENTCLFSLNRYPMVVDSRLLNRSDIISTRVYGEVVVPHRRHYDGLMAQLDHYEDYHPKNPQASLYWRELREVTVFTPEPQPMLVWVYMGNPEFLPFDAPLIPVGDWVKYCEDRFRGRHRFRGFSCCE
ncbi:MAG: gamma-glutamylcyclotransferase [Anaerolineae bacterium]|nr:gamma-glutamylcyclotransferase [Anaerolineae bacterium]